MIVQPILSALGGSLYPLTTACETGATLGPCGAGGGLRWRGDRSRGYAASRRVGSSRNHALAPAEFGLLPTLVGGDGVSDERYPLGIFEWLDLAGSSSRLLCWSAWCSSPLVKINTPMCWRWTNPCEELIFYVRLIWVQFVWSTPTGEVVRICCIFFVISCNVLLV